MLVFHKMPMGYVQIDNYRVYGKKYSMGSFGPTDIPMSIYLENKDLFEEAEYTGRWLNKTLGTDFPESLKFHISSLRSIDFDNLVVIAKGLGVKYIRATRVAPTLQEKNALIKTIVLNLNKQAECH